MKSHEQTNKQTKLIDIDKRMVVTRGKKSGGRTKREKKVKYMVMEGD